MRTINERTRGSRQGFTLVELLAVIAIIGILAAIVVPQVTKYIARARMTRAVSEVNGAETALVGVLTDTGRSNFRDFLTQERRTTIDGWSAAITAGGAGAISALEAADSFYKNFFYELLRQGRNSEFIKLEVVPEVRQKLGTFYMDIGRDPWGQQYNFWMGPIRGPVPLRSYRIAATTYDEGLDVPEPDDPDFTLNDAYVYHQRAYDDALQDVPGQPRRDDDTIPAAFGAMFPDIEAYGFPAPNELPVYIWSSGPNTRNDANLLVQMRSSSPTEFPDFMGGGDDPNNWDNEGGWDNAPKL